MPPSEKHAVFLNVKQVCQQEYDDYMALPEESKNQEMTDLKLQTLDSANKCFINYNRNSSSDPWLES